MTERGERAAQWGPGYYLGAAESWGRDVEGLRANVANLGHGSEQFLMAAERIWQLEGENATLRRLLREAAIDWLPCGCGSCGNCAFNARVEAALAEGKAEQ